MGAKFNFFVVGRTVNGKAPAWSDLLTCTEPLISRVVGRPSTYLLLNMTKESERRGPLSELHEVSIRPDELLSLYPSEEGLGVGYSYSGAHWEFCLFLPVHNLSEESVEEILIELWDRSNPIGRVFAAAGEELEVWDSADALVAGAVHPLDVPLCSIAVVSNAVPPKNTILTQRTLEYGTFCRGSFQLCGKRSSSVSRDGM